MIIAIVPSPLRFSVGTMIYGSTDNTVLPDYLLGTKLSSPALLNKKIGDNFILPNEQFYKIYSVEGGVLHEYTAFKFIDASGRFLYTPISLKRYDSTENFTYTYLYLKGVTSVLDSLRGTRDYNIISLYQLLQFVDVDQANVIYRNKIPYDPVSISLEHPEIIEDLLSTISQNGLMSPADTRYCLEITLKDCADGITLLNKIPEDFISIYGCSYSPFIEEKELMTKRAMSQCELFSLTANDQITGMSNQHLLSLDLSTPVFQEFEFDKIISQLYCLPFTNVIMEINDTGNLDKYYYSVLFNKTECIQSMMLNVLRKPLANAIRVYNKTHLVHLSRIALCKTWLDELYFDMYYADGGHQTYYTNLSAYHLYTPSLIRLHSIT